MARLGEAWVNIRSNLKPLRAGLNKAYSMVKNVMRKMTSFITRATKWAALGFVAVSTAAVKMAMDAQESENLFEVSMGNMARATRKWSDQMSKALGLNAFEVRRFVSTFNVMLESMGIAPEKTADMSKKLVELTYDMASFFNLRPAEAFQKLQAGITGEIEPLKRLGILVNETTIQQWALNNKMIEGKEKLTEVQKVMARYAVILKQTQKAQGDLERTAGSATNILRSLKSQVVNVAIAYGTELLPVVTKLAKVMRNWLAENKDRFAAWGKAVGGWVNRVYVYFKVLYDLIQARGWTAGITKITIDIVRAFKAMWKILKKDVYPAAIEIGRALGKGIYAGLKAELPDFMSGLEKLYRIGRWTPMGLYARGGAAISRAVRGTPETVTQAEPRAYRKKVGEF